MTETADPMFRCDVCGRRHAWTPELAGQTITCACGEPAPVPAEPESDLYDIAPTAPVPVRPVSPEASYDASSPALSYQRPIAAAVDETYSEANPLIVSVQRDLILPIVLIFLGTVAQFVWAFQSGAAAGSPGRAAAIVGFDFILDVLVMLGGVIVAARVLSISFGPVPTAILKLGAIALGPTGITALIVWGLGGGVGAQIAGWLLRLAIYVWLFWYLFELEMDELWNTIIIVYGVRTIAMFAWYIVFH
jgi:hypothetical protein